jgi:hypothetical protein
MNGGLWGLQSLLSAIQLTIGCPDHGHLLLGPLKILSSAEEAIVRDRAIESMEAVYSSIPAANADTNLIQTARPSSSCRNYAVSFRQI